MSTIPTENKNIEKPLVPVNPKIEKPVKPVFLGSVKGKLLALLVVGFMALTTGNFVIVGATIFSCLSRPPQDTPVGFEADKTPLDNYEFNSSVSIHSSADICVYRSLSLAQSTLKESFVVLLSMWSGVVALKKDREDD